MLYIPTVIYIFEYVFNKLNPGWFIVGTHSDTWGRVSQVGAWGCNFPLYKVKMRASAMASLLWVRVSTQCTYQTHVQTFPLKGAWCHQGIMWWCQIPYDDIPVMWGILDDDIYISIKRGIKGRMHKRGFPCLEFWAHRPKSTSSTVLWCIPALG